MGYTIACRAKDRKVLKKMADFMEVHYRKPHEIFNQKNDYSILSNNAFHTDDSKLSYDRNPLAIGFDYNACDPERDYIFSVTRWMALKIGKTKKFKSLDIEVPYYVYDGGHCGDDRWPLLVDTVWKDKDVGDYGWCIISPVGFKSKKHKYIGSPVWDSLNSKERKSYIDYLDKATKDLTGLSIKEIDSIIKRELLKLEKSWNNGV